MHEAKIQDTRERLTAAERYRTETALIEAAKTAAAIMEKYTDEEIAAAIKSATPEELDTLTIAELLAKPKLYELKKKNKPKSRISPHDKISSSFRDPQKIEALNNEKAVRLWTGKKKDTKMYVTVYIPQLTGLEENTLRRLERLTPFDKAVYDAICTLYKAGNTYITDRDVLAVMGASTKGAAEKQIEAIRESVEKMQSIRITIKSSEEEARRYNAAALLDRTGVILPLIVDTWIYKRQKVKGYKLLDEPLLLWYAEIKRQVLTKPIEELKLESVSATKKNIIIKQLIIDLLPMISEEKTVRLSLEKVYSETGSESDKAKEKSRESTKKILGELQENGIIAGYKEEKNGSAIKNYVIW